MPHSKTMRFPRSAKIQKMEVKNVLFSDPVNGIKSQNSHQLFSVTAPMIFWVEMHILWSGISSPFHIYSMYCHHLYEFPVIKASVSSSIWSLCHTMFPSFNSQTFPLSHYSRHEFVFWGSKVRTVQLSRWDSTVS